MRAPIGLTGAASRPENPNLRAQCCSDDVSMLAVLPSINDRWWRVTCSRMWHALVDPPRRIRPIEVGDVVKSSQGTSIGEVQGLMLDLTSDCTYAVLAADEVLDEGDTLYAVPEEAFNQLEADFAWELNLDTDESAEGEVQKILVLR